MPYTATGAISGKLGKVQMDPTTPADLDDINGWRMTRSFEELDASNFSGAGHAESVPGLSKWRGTFTSQKYQAQLSGTRTLAVFYTTATPTTSHPKFSGSILVLSEGMECMVDGKLSYAYEFAGQLGCTPGTS